MVKVAIVSNFRAVGNHLKRLVSKAGIGKVVCMSIGESDSKERILKSEAELIIMQTSLIKQDGLTLITEIKEQMNAIFIGYALSYNLYQAMRLYQGELDSLILDDQEEDEQIQNLMDSYYGKRIFPDDFISHREYCLEEDPCLLHPLTTRERQMITLTAAGMSNKEIAGEMKVCLRTIEGHKRRVYQKTGLASIAHLTRLAIEEGYMDLV